jgi:hypothetical protein
MVASLKTQASGKLAQCEEVIERGLDSFIEVGNALLIIREERLYKDDYDDFKTYCQERWDTSDRHAHRLIDSAEVMQNIGTDQIGQSGPLPSQQLKESQVRPLVALPPSDQRKAWEGAVKSSKNGKPTAKQVADSVLLVRGRTPVTVKLNGRVTNSVTLQALKRLWKQASAADQEAFRKWIA